MAPAEALLKKQDQQETMKDIALEAVALAAQRSADGGLRKEKFSVVSLDVTAKRQEAERKMKQESLEQEQTDLIKKQLITNEGDKEEQWGEEEVDSTSNSLKERVPWLANNMKMRGRQHKEGKENKRRVGTIDQSALESLQEEGPQNELIIPPPTEFLVSSPTDHPKPTSTPATKISRTEATKPNNSASATNIHTTKLNSRIKAIKTQATNGDKVSLRHTLSNKSPASTKTTALPQTSTNTKSKTKGMSFDDDYYNTVITSDKF